MKFSFLKFVLISSSVCFGTSIYAATDAEETSTTNIRDLRPNYLSYDRYGVGLIWGTLTGVSAKYWIDDRQAIQVSAAFADSNTAVGADYLWNFRGVLGSYSTFPSAYNFAPFVGAGLLSSFGASTSNTRIFDHDHQNFNLAVRAPLGVEYLPTHIHLGFFGEIGLGLGFIPDAYTFATADVGARYYF